MKWIFYFLLLECTWHIIQTKVQITKKKSQIFLLKKQIKKMKIIKISES